MTVGLIFFFFSLKQLAYWRVGPCMRIRSLFIPAGPHIHGTVGRVFIW